MFYLSVFVLQVYSTKSDAITEEEDDDDDKLSRATCYRRALTDVKTNSGSY